MNCNETRLNFLNYAEGALSVEKIQEIEKHFRDCDECPVLYNEVKATYVVFDGAVVPEPSVEIFNKIEDRIHRHAIQVNFERYTLNNYISKIAASVLIVIGVGLGVLVGKQSGELKATSSGSFSEEIEAFAGEYSLKESGQSLEAFLTNE